MPKPPPPSISPQEFARRNNENAAVQRAFQRRLGRLRRRTKAAEDQAWREAEREARPIRAVGYFLPKPQTPPKA